MAVRGDILPPLSIRHQPHLVSGTADKISQKGVHVREKMATVFYAGDPRTVLS
jgi:hypothetical protein